MHIIMIDRQTWKHRDNTEFIFILKFWKLIVVSIYIHKFMKIGGIAVYLRKSV